MLVNTNVCFVSWNHNSFGFQRSHLSFDGMKLRKEDMSPNSSVSPLSPFPNPYCLDPVFFFLTFLTHLLPLIHSQHILYSLISAPIKFLTQSRDDQDSVVLVLNVFQENQFYLRSLQLPADSGPRPRPRFQSLLVATDWQSCYPYPQPFSAHICQLRQELYAFRWTHTTIFIWRSMPTALVLVDALDTHMHAKF